MMNSSDITQSGFYWYWDAIGGDPTIVEVGPVDSPKRDLEVRFAGREDADLLHDLSGQFAGPVVPPLT